MHVCVYMFVNVYASVIYIVYLLTVYVSIFFGILCSCHDRELENLLVTCLQIQSDNSLWVIGWHLITGSFCINRYTLYNVMYISCHTYILLHIFMHTLIHTHMYIYICMYVVSQCYTSWYWHCRLFLMCIAATAWNSIDLWNHSDWSKVWLLQYSPNSGQLGDWFLVLWILNIITYNIIYICIHTPMIDGS